LGVGPTTLPRKTNLVKETETKRNRMDSQMKTFSTKRTTRIGCWNVNTLRVQGKATYREGRSSRPEEKIAGSEGPGREDSETEKVRQGPMLHIGVEGMVTSLVL
jgi:hypothetical protein